MLTQSGAIMSATQVYQDTYDEAMGMGYGEDYAKNLAGQATAVFQQRGIFKAPKLEKIDTASGIGFFNPSNGKITIKDIKLFSKSWNGKANEYGVENKTHFH